MLGALMPIAGIPMQQSLQLPTADNLPGTDRPTRAMAVDANGNLYFENQIVSQRVLVNDLMVATNTARAPLTLVIHADKSVSYETLANLTLLARDHGITNIILATLPPVEIAPAKP
jgi:biopolymer transport protein ExbD